MWKRMGLFLRKNRLLGGSGEKSSSKDMESVFSNFQISQNQFLIENPTHWGLETAVCPIFSKPV